MLLRRGTACECRGACRQFEVTDDIKDDGSNDMEVVITAFGILLGFWVAVIWSSDHFNRNIT